MFEHNTVCLLYLLCCFFKQIDFVKPGNILPYLILSYHTLPYPSDLSFPSYLSFLSFFPIFPILPILPILPSFLSFLPILPSYPSFLSYHSFLPILPFYPSFLSFLPSFLSFLPILNPSYPSFLTPIISFLLQSFLSSSYLLPPLSPNTFILFLDCLRSLPHFCLLF